VSCGFTAITAPTGGAPTPIRGSVRAAVGFGVGVGVRVLVEVLDAGGLRSGDTILKVTGVTRQR
jgi:hypothetical protein